MVDKTGLSENDIREYFQINPAGNISKDFPSNIYFLNAYYEGIGELKEIRNKSDEIKNKVSKLNNPSSDYKKAYDELLDIKKHYK